MHKQSFVYILSSPNFSALYIGVTGNLAQRIFQHRNKVFPNSFTAKYNCVILVYYEIFNDIRNAIDYEKKLKNYSRKMKDELIYKFNPEMRDLSSDVFTS